MDHQGNPGSCLNCLLCPFGPHRCGFFFFFITVLLSGIIRYSRLILSICFLNPRVNHFSKESWYLLLGDGIRKQDWSKLAVFIAAGFFSFPLYSYIFICKNCYILFPSPKSLILLYWYSVSIRIIKNTYTGNREGKVLLWSAFLSGLFALIVSFKPQSIFIYLVIFCSADAYVVCVSGSER